uniref:C-type lectin domain-containing protein n=1 Tax=Sinocyclocheilus anshuiensis TaxID=1608454 RepID=A0A671RIG7_9TELE
MCCRFDGLYSVSYHFTDGGETQFSYSSQHHFIAKALRCSGPDWYEFGEFCYKPFEEKKTWHSARTACRQLGADLVSIRSMTEQMCVCISECVCTKERETTSDVWIGLNDLGFSGLFSWSDHHEATFTYWAPGEPHNHLGFSEDCVEMYHETARWNDVTCSELNTYVCKMPKGHYPLPSVQPTIYGCPQVSRALS